MNRYDKNVLLISFYLIDKVYLAYNNKDTGWVTSLSEVSSKNAMMKLDEVRSQVFLSFEGVLHPVPACYHKYLSNYYGEDYMELPPVEKRIQHDILEVDFGKYA